MFGNLQDGISSQSAKFFLPILLKKSHFLSFSNLAAVVVREEEGAVDAGEGGEHKLDLLHQVLHKMNEREEREEREENTSSISSIRSYTK